LIYFEENNCRNTMQDDNKQILTNNSNAIWINPNSYKAACINPLINFVKTNNVINKKEY
jgi:hypothetical protein